MRGSAEYWWKTVGSLKFCGNLSFFLNFFIQPQHCPCCFLLTHFVQLLVSHFSLIRNNRKSINLFSFAPHLPFSSIFLRPRIPFCYSSFFNIPISKLSTFTLLLLIFFYFTKNVHPFLALSTPPPSNLFHSCY
jgi:hypothetical protein